MGNKTLRNKGHKKISMVIKRIKYDKPEMKKLKKRGRKKNQPRQLFIEDIYQKSEDTSEISIEVKYAVSKMSNNRGL